MRTLELSISLTSIKDKKEAVIQQAYCVHIPRVEYRVGIAEKTIRLRYTLGTPVIKL